MALSAHPAATIKGVRVDLADELEEFVRLGGLWDDAVCAGMVDRLLAESTETADPLPARLGRFIEAVLIRSRMGDVSQHLVCDIDAIVYPRLWKLVEAIRDGMPDGELRTRIEVMNRRLSRLFVEEG
jgi:hypothetical protein